MLIVTQHLERLIQVVFATETAYPYVVYNRIYMEGLNAVSH